MKRRTGLVYTLTAAMLLSLAAPAAFGAQETDQVTLAIAQEQESETESAAKDEGVRETGVRMALTRENTLRNEAGMSVGEWDDAVNAKKLEGAASPLTKDAVLEANPEAQIREKDNIVYYMDHVDALGNVSDVLDAYRAAYSAMGMTGGNEHADLRLWQQMDINGMKIYSFQQIADSEMVMGSTMKIAVKDGKVCAVFSSLDPAEGKEERILTQDEIQEAVRGLLDSKGDDSLILPEYTDRVRHTPILLEDLDLDTQEDDPVPEQLLWVVYTKNKEGSEYPITAHYVSLDGQYIDSLEVESAGSEEALCGFRRQDVFDGMEADTWTGEITGVDDNVRTVTLPIMKDRDGRLYLGDVNRRIAVADFAKAVYDDSHRFELVQSDENAVFDNEDLYMYFNYLTAWDFYSDMGWIGPDGEGTDVIILKNLCTRDGTPFENACSIGLVQGFQMFGYTAYALDGTPLSLGHGLDVMAHEYTHTFTSTIMNSNLYENDQGAINEAMSDIMGNLVELISEETDDTLWLLGEKTGSVYRSMSDPAAYQQPAYVWDEFYGPETDTPSSANDRGGVHSNSSLLNQIAAKLCREYGMSYEDAVRFWVMAAGGLTPKTDYPQICPLLRWALTVSGNEDQADNLEQIISDEHLDREEIPEKLPYNRKIVHLDIPGTEAFDDENWALMSIQLNTETLEQFAITAVKLAVQAIKGGADPEKIGTILSDFLDRIHLDGTMIKLDEKDDAGKIADAVADALSSALSRLIEQSVAWSSTREEGITFVTDNDPAFYVLINVNNSGTKLNGCAVLIGERWVDLSSFLEMGTEILTISYDTDSAEEESGAGTIAESVLETLSGLTPQQWETLFNLARAVYEAVHPDKSAGDGAASESIMDNLLGLGLAVMEYVNADEEERSEGLLFPAKTQELSSKGLEEVKLLKE